MTAVVLAVAAVEACVIILLLAMLPPREPRPAYQPRHTRRAVPLLPDDETVTVIHSGDSGETELELLARVRDRLKALPPVTGTPATARDLAVARALWPEAADVEHSERCCMEGAQPGWGPHPDCAGVAALDEFRQRTIANIAIGATVVPLRPAIGPAVIR